MAQTDAQDSTELRAAWRVENSILLPSLSSDSLSRPNSSKRTKTTPPSPSSSSPVLPRAPREAQRDALQSPSTPELKKEQMVSSTPKLADNVAQQQRYSHFDDEGEEEEEEEFSEEEETPHQDVRVADMESDISEEEDESELFGR